jgi:hypothetical protein
MDCIAQVDLYDELPSINDTDFILASASPCRLVSLPLKNARSLLHSVKHPALQGMQCLLFVKEL